ncbi:hypothetical protein ACFYWX_29890 [Streptomyces sp. NPDC002888]|uniref:hypothetical protein n=1 Tax=Streptomyces sp. NPDC002888 TaxID=3364668 RepID=UPI0036990C4E
MASVLGVLGFCVSPFLGDKWGYALASASLALAISIGILVHKYGSSRAFFTQISFSTPDRATALASLIRGESSRPHFASLAPRPDECQIVVDQLKAEGTATITGGPGEGKSLLAYHVAQALQHRHKTYQLHWDRAIGVSRTQFHVELEGELDALKGRLRFVIIDDAHLADETWIGDVVRELLQRAVSERDTKTLWIRTQNPESVAGEELENSVKIDYDKLAPKQTDFYSATLREYPQIFDQLGGLPPWRIVTPEQHGTSHSLHLEEMRG